MLSWGPPGEQGHDAPHCELGFRTQRFVAVVRDRVADHGERIAGQAVHPRDDLRAALEAVGDDGDRRYAQALGLDGVVQTARRAAPSIADGGK